MKKTTIYILIAFTGLIFTSCTTAKWVAPPFTNVGKIIQVKKGMSMEQTNKTLGIEPYNMYNIQETASSVLVYHYRTQQRRMGLSLDSDKSELMKYGQETSQTNGQPYYNEDFNLVYVLFKDNKVVSLITDQGRSDSEYLLLVNNNIKAITKQEYTTFKSKIDTTQYTDMRIIPMSDTFNKAQKGKSEMTEEKAFNRPRLKPQRILFYYFVIPLIVDYFTWD